MNVLRGVYVNVLGGWAGVYVHVLGGVYVNVLGVVWAGVYVNVLGGGSM